MKQKIKNPCLLSGYKGPDYFCDRRAETDKIVEALENGGNLTPISPRRMGKSGLIRNAFYYLSKNKDEGVEALLRSYMQRMTNVRFIFSGSQKHIMEKLFTSASQPFFQSTQMLQLGAISLKEYSKFILKHFEKAEKNISQEAIDFAYQTAGGKFYTLTNYKRAL